MRIHIEIDSDETDLAAVAKAIQALNRGSKPKSPEDLGGTFSDTERSDQPAARLPTPIGFHPDPDF